MDVGRALQRWEFDDAPAFPSVSWILSEVESRLLNAWINQVAKAGWFSIPLLSDMGFETVTARFVETPKRAELVGRYSWKYAATLEIEFEPMLDEGWAEILPEYVLLADIFDYIPNREWPTSQFGQQAEILDVTINVQWPE
jgi:hypothetical protein